MTAASEKWQKETSWSQVVSWISLSLTLLVSRMFESAIQPAVNGVRLWQRQNDRSKWWTTAILYARDVVFCAIPAPLETTIRSSAVAKKSFAHNTREKLRTSLQFWFLADRTQCDQLLAPQCRVSVQFLRVTEFGKLWHTVTMWQYKNVVCPQISFNGHFSYIRKPLILLPMTLSRVALPQCHSNHWLDALISFMNIIN